MVKKPKSEKQFLSELYAIMVDPRAGTTVSVPDMRQALWTTALRQCDELQRFKDALASS